MKEARVQVKVPLVPRPGVQEPEENAVSGVEKDKPAPLNLRTVPSQPARLSTPERVSTDELNRQATEQIHIPVIELDQFRRVKRRRMWTFARKPRWGRNATRWQPAAAVSALLAMALLIPVILVWPRTTESPKPIPAPTDASSTKTPAPVPAVPVTYPEPQVRVYLSATGTTMNLPLEDYVTGVVAAEMPAAFRLEALKAQAIAARTFIVRRLAASDTSGVPSGAADVTDTVSHQVFIPPDQVKADWTRLGKAKEWEKLQQAVRESRDTVMTYQGKAITASFFPQVMGIPRMRRMCGVTLYRICKVWTVHGTKPLPQATNRPLP